MITSWVTSGPTLSQAGAGSDGRERPLTRQDVLEQCADPQILEKMEAEELNRLLASLREAQSGLLTVMRRKGVAPPLFDLRDAAARTVRVGRITSTASLMLASTSS